MKANHTAMAGRVALDGRDILGGNGILGESHDMLRLPDVEAAHAHEERHDITTLLVRREITERGACS